MPAGGVGDAHSMTIWRPFLDSMVAADVIVMATPVYFYTMCAQMKTVIDRTVPQYTKIAKKDFYIYCDRGG